MHACSSATNITCAQLWYDTNWNMVGTYYVHMNSKLRNRNCTFALWSEVGTCVSNFISQGVKCISWGFRISKLNESSFHGVFQIFIEFVLIVSIAELWRLQLGLRSVWNVQYYFPWRSSEQCCLYFIWRIKEQLSCVYRTNKRDCNIDNA